MFTRTLFPHNDRYSHLPKYWSFLLNYPVKNISTDFRDIRYIEVHGKDRLKIPERCRLPMRYPSSNRCCSWTSQKRLRARSGVFLETLPVDQLVTKLPRILCHFISFQCPQNPTSYPLCESHQYRLHPNPASWISFNIILPFRPKSSKLFLSSSSLPKFSPKYLPHTPPTS
jgi:hypothetical protein